MSLELAIERTPESIAKAITDAIKGDRLTSWRELGWLLMDECNLPEEEALAVSEAVSRKWQLRFFPAITRMELFITEDCNLRCDYCFVEGKNPSHAMSPETARKAIDFLFAESRGEKRLSLFFMGGEPFLAFDLMRTTVEYAEQRAKRCEKTVDFSVTTNGTLFAEEILAYCAQHRISFLLSLDGARESHDRHRKTVSGKGSFDRIMRWLPRMKQHQPYMGARVTVHPDAVHELLDNIRFLADQGINHFIIGPASGLEWSGEELETYEAQMKAVVDFYKEKKAQDAPLQFDLLRQLDNLYDSRGIWGCQAGRHSITIAANGDIYPCSKMLGLNELGGIYRLGDLEKGITDLDARSELVGMWPKRRTRCMTCDLADACAGGCFANNYKATGSIFEPCETQCRITRCNFQVRQYAAQVFAVQPRKAGSVNEPAEDSCAV